METLLLNARRVLKAEGPMLVNFDFLIVNGDGLKTNLFSMDTHADRDFQIARLINMELARDENKYDWRELYLLK